MNILASTNSERVHKHTRAEVNRRIRARTLSHLRDYEDADPSEISERIAELKREWDIERVLEANAAGIALVGLALGATVNRRWFALPAVVAGFLLQHAIQGWCPPLPVFRRMGVRTAAEIHEEMVALKSMRGDFARGTGTADRAARSAQLR